MIPKIIQCCWYGGNPMPSSVKRFMKTWRRCLPDYEIKVWTENEFDPMSSIPYVREAYECEKYAFVSDYVRLYALNEYGGIYLDTDVEVLKSFDPFLDGPFMCFESDEHLFTAVIAAEKDTEWVKEVLEMYKPRHFLKEGRMDLTTNVEFITQYFTKRGLNFGGQRQEVNGVIIYPSSYFSPKSWGTGKYHIASETVMVHHFAGTWHSKTTRILSIFFSNNTIIKIASLKEKILKSIKNVFAKS